MFVEEHWSMFVFLTHTAGLGSQWEPIGSSFVSVRSRAQAHPGRIRFSSKTNDIGKEFSHRQNSIT
jgi:hypothetical protein